MQYLSLKESKEITIKFLKYFNCYNKERFERYFIHQQSMLKISFFNFICKFFTKSLPIVESIYSDADFKKYYDTYLFTSFLMFEDDEKKINRLCKALEKALKENNIHLLYKIDAFSSEENSSLLVKDIGDWNKVGGTGQVIFSNDFSFLFEFDSDDAMLFYSSQKIINDFKKNYPEYCRDFTL
ncbi:MAG: hypothetical protein AB1465_07210 [Patescibacteria group bacterium]